MYLDEEWVREAERLHGRYLSEVVEAYDLCPWAQRARLGGQTRVAVVLDGEDTAAVESSIAILDRWTDERMDIGFLVLPRLRVGRHEFDRFVARLRSLDTGRHPQGSPAFALAAFHPEAEADLNHAERLIPFLRRTPDPCVQAVRMTALDRVRRGTPGGTQFVDIAAINATAPDEPPAVPLRERIARTNLETVRKAGVGALSACFEAIERDRAKTYGALEAREAAATAQATP